MALAASGVRWLVIRERDQQAERKESAEKYGAMRAVKQELFELRGRLEQAEHRIADLESRTIQAPVTAEADTEREPITEPELPVVTLPSDVAVETPTKVAVATAPARQYGRPELIPTFEPSRPPESPPTGRSGIEPGPFDELGAFIGRITGGNSVARVGVILLLIGIGFLMQYAARRNMFPIELRVIGAYALGLLLVAVGWRLRNKRFGYAVSLQGGGLGVIYVATIGALQLYSLIPKEVAFGLLVLTVVAEGALALACSSLALAVLATLGGFAAPILVSDGSGNHIAMFAWYAILNAGVFFLAHKKSWRQLHHLGFVFTFGVATVWGVLSYSPTRFASSQGFLLLFWAMYFVIPMVYARRQARLDRPTVDAPLVFVLPVAVFGLQYSLVEAHEYGAAWTALGMGAIWSLAAVWLIRVAKLPRLGLAYTAIGVALATLAVPLAFSPETTSAIWALEGCGLIWIGLRDALPRWSISGFALIVLGGAALLPDFEVGQGGFMTNPSQLGATVVMVSALLGGWLFARKQQLEAARALLGWGVAWWVVPLALELNARLDGAQLRAAYLFAAGSTAVGYAWVGRLGKWPDLQRVAVGGVAVNAALAGWALVSPLHPLGGLLAISWPFALAAAAVCLYWADPHLPEPAQDFGADVIGELIFGVMAWTLALVLAAEISWLLQPARTLGWALGPALVLVAVVPLRRQRRWPFERWPIAWHFVVPLPLAVAVTLWVAWFGLTAAPWDGGVPLLNPVDLTVIACAAAGAWWVRRDWPERIETAEWGWPAGVTMVLAVTGIVARTVAGTTDLAWSTGALYDSVLLQAALSITWTLVALPVMTLASRTKRRGPWVGGAILLGVVTLKLLLVDLSSAATVARIVSFLGVGLLLLVIGYVAPIPSGEDEPAETTP